TRTARQALEAVRSMQTEHEPLANRANVVLEKLIAYDRAVGEYVQAHSADDKLSTITLAGDALEAAVAEYFSSAPPRAVTAAATGLRQQLTRHIANARQLATRASQRLQWDARRQAALDDVYRRIVSAGGSGLAINGTQVVAERSLAELHTAINAVRGNLAPSAVIAQRELQLPAREGLLLAAQHAATAAEGAEHTLRNTSFAVLALMLLVSALLAVSISVPVRRLTAATRLLAGGDRGARAPRGGSAEIDELAESFNTMADRIAHAETELRAHQTELEQRVAERTRQLHHLAHHDPLTQLPNRRSLGAQVEARAADIVATLQEPLLVDGRVLTTGASVGASLPGSRGRCGRVAARRGRGAVPRQGAGPQPLRPLQSRPLRRRGPALQARAVAAPRGRERRPAADVPAPGRAAQLRIDRGGGAAALAQGRRPHRHRHRVHPGGGGHRPHPRADRLDPAHRGLDR